MLRNVGAGGLEYVGVTPAMTQAEVQVFYPSRVGLQYNALWPLDLDNTSWERFRNCGSAAVSMLTQACLNPLMNLIHGQAGARIARYWTSDGNATPWAWAI